MVVINGLEN